MSDLTREEREYLTETLEAAHTQLLHALHHVDRKRFRDLLRQRVEINERLREKFDEPYEEKAS